MIFRRSITAKFIATVFIVLLIVQSIGTIAFLSYIRSSYLEEIELRIRETAGMMAGVSMAPLLSYDFALIDTYLDLVSRQDDITSVHIFDNNGKAVREKIKADDSDISPLNPFYLRKSMTVTVPVEAGGGKIGEVSIHYSGRSVNDNIHRSMMIIVLFQGIVLVFVSVVMAYLFSRHIKRPVSVINGTIEKITTGDLTFPVPDLGEDEIGSIAKGVAFLEQRLLFTVSAINGTAAKVSAAIGKVDHSYRVMGEGLNKQTDAVKDVERSTATANASQIEISAGVEKLLEFSTENVSSLLEMKASSEEMASQTQRLFKATEDSYSIVSEMSQTSKAIAANAGAAMSAVEDTSASVEELSASVKEVGVFAGDSSRIAETVKDITSGEGMMAVVNAVEGMDSIAGQVKMSSDIIQRLGVRSVDIEKVLSVIRDVTEQTNLLSLNAAILAAQAGEYGKSFSVVADEIRALSERTASSTREIGGIVKTIQKDIKDAVGAIDAAQVKVEEGNGLVVRVGEVLREILHASTSSADMTKAIERATAEQGLGLSQVMDAVEEIRKVMKSVAKSTKEQEDALSYLLEGVSEIKEVAEVSKRGAGEQAEGTRLITKNIELANERLQQISANVSKQKKLNEQTIAVLARINAIGTSTVLDMGEVSSALMKLFSEIETLKHDMKVFRIT